MNAPPVTATAQNTRLSIAEAMSRFKQYTDDTDVHRYGQFAWYEKLSSEVHSAIDSVLKSASTNSPHLEQALRHRKPMSTSYEGPIMDLLEATRDVSSEKQYSAKWNDVMNILHAHPCAEATALETLIGGSESTGRTVSEVASGDYQRGVVFAQSTPDYSRVFRNPANVRLTVLRGLLKASKDACFATANAVAAHINQKHRGLKGGLGTKSGVSLNGQITSAALVRNLQPPPPDPEYGELVRYTADIYAPKGAVEQMKLNLDRGYILRGEVLSGWAINAPGAPDHFLLIIAFEANPIGDIFCYWDPDAAVTSTIERGFGRLYCVPGSDATKGSRFGNYFAHGRFSTGASESDLRLIDGQAGHYKTDQKRYLILRAAPVP